MPHFPDFTKIDLPPSKGMRVQSGALPATPENAEQIAIPALALGHADQQGFAANSQPGFAPFLRGPYPSMYATRPWTIRQYAGFRPRRNPIIFTAAIWQPGKWGYR